MNEADAIVGVDGFEKFTINGLTPYWVRRAMDKFISTNCRMREIIYTYQGYSDESGFFYGWVFIEGKGRTIAL